MTAPVSSFAEDPTWIARVPNPSVVFLTLLKPLGCWADRLSTGDIYRDGGGSWSGLRYEAFFVSVNPRTWRRMASSADGSSPRAHFAGSRACASELSQETCQCKNLKFSYKKNQNPGIEMKGRQETNRLIVYQSHRDWRQSGISFVVSKGSSEL
jgi:hypothetical protein